MREGARGKYLRKARIFKYREMQGAGERAIAKGLGCGRTCTGHGRYKGVSGWNAYNMQKEYYFTCPYCWQQISMLLDLSVSSQAYVEDCEVCCNPIEVYYEVLEEEVVAFEAIPST